jgi:CheY-like chemotaxis protein
VRPESGAVTNTVPVWLRILLADCGAASRCRAQASLERINCTVRTAATSDEALGIALGGWFFDLLVTDLDVPKTGGVTLIRALRLRRPWLPVVIITARSRDECVAVQRESQEWHEGPLVFARKPTSAAELVNAVTAAWMGRHR